jgi:cytochrome c oxidase subunit 3
MKHLYGAAWMVFALGVIGVLYTMASWWGDVIKEAQYKGDHTRVVQISHRYGMILFIASEVMFFVAWFWAFFNSALFPADAVHAARDAIFGCGEGTAIGACSVPGTWPPKGIEAFDPWHLPLLNTLLLLTSGTTVTWAHHALLENDRQGLKYGLILTILLGAAFTCVQAWEYSHALFHFSGNIYGATFFMATGFHGFHVLVGTVFLIVCLARAYAGHFTPKQHLGFEFAAWYWHFVDVSSSRVTRSVTRGGRRAALFVFEPPMPPTAWAPARNGGVRSTSRHSPSPAQSCSVPETWLPRCLRSAKTHSGRPLSHHRHRTRG